jgi:hypothetical protein
MEIIINIDIRRKEAKAFLEYIKTLNFIKIKTSDVPNDETKKAIDDAYKGKTTPVKRKSDNIVDDILNS